MRLNHGQPLGVRATYVAGSAGFPLRCFPEMGADLEMAALVGFHKTANLVVSLPGALLFLRIADVLNEVGQQAHITPLPQQEAIGGLSITARATGLLVVLLDGLGEC